MPKKTTAKKTAKAATKRTPKMAEMPMPEAHACTCGGECKCGCHHGKFKKFIVLVIVFLIGFAVAKMTCCHHGMHRMPKMNPVFENGCLVMESIKCPKMVEALANADVDMNGCITMEEFKTIKREMRREMRGPREMPEMPEPPVME